MDRKGIIGIVLCLAILIWWQLKTQKELEAWRAANPEFTQQQAQPAAATPEAASTATPEASLTAPSLNAATPAGGAVAADAPEQTLVIKAPLAEYTFSSKGGGIRTVRLLGHDAPEADENVVLNAKTHHPIGAVLDDPALPENPSYELSEKPGQVIATRRVPNGPVITKTFSLPMKDEDGYRVGLTVTFSNPGEQPIEKTGYYLHAGTIAPLHKEELSYYSGLDWSADGDVERTRLDWFDAKKIPLLGIERAAAQSYYIENPGNVLWLGIKNQYFTSLIVATREAPAKGVWAQRVIILLDSPKPADLQNLPEVQGVQAALAMPPFRVAPGESFSQDFTLYVGPKEYRQLASLGANEAELMDFGMFKIICVFLLNSMNWLEGHLGSYALAIIVLTFIVRGLLWPVQGKANASMKRMQALAPKMAELKEKFSDDPPRMNQEMMKLYKDYGVNPFAGCLPMLIQIPIFFGFYSMLGTAVELRHSSFLWVNDLSLPDTVAHVFGFPINILPLLMAGTMLLQMALTPKSGDAMQQRIFMFMPLIFVIFTYNFASALALYYTVQNLLSILQLYLTRNAPMPELVKRTAAPAAPAAKLKGKKRK